MFHLGTIHCCAGDQSQPEFDIKHVKHAKAVKEMLSDMVERERMERRVGVRELMQGAEEGDMFSQDDAAAVHMDEEWAGSKWAKFFITAADDFRRCFYRLISVVDENVRNAT